MTRDPKISSAGPLSPDQRTRIADLLAEGVTRYLKRGGLNRRERRVTDGEGTVTTNQAFENAAVTDVD